MKTKPDYLESQEFYDLMQCYRIAGQADQENVIRRFEAVKDFIKEKSTASEILEALHNLINAASGDTIENLKIALADAKATIKKATE